jgi:hypothetical protein
MATHDERLASFEPRKPKSQKKSAVNTAIAKGWPHPESFKARPNTLAHAGFYFDPTSSKNDNVTCFTCEHSLGEWTQDDDPFVEHLNVAPKCAWAIARCNVELDRQADGRCVLCLLSLLLLLKYARYLAIASVSHPLQGCLRPKRWRRQGQTHSKVSGFTIK